MFIEIAYHHFSSFVATIILFLSRNFTKAIYLCVILCRKLFRFIFGGSNIVKVCSLPTTFFSRKSTLYAKIDSFNCGILPIYLSHSKNFCGQFPWTQRMLLANLKIFLIPKNYAGFDGILSIQFDGVAHLWNVYNFDGYQQIVTIIKPLENGHYELVDAFMRERQYFV